jgi:UDP-N-acetyl-2-amino-2-deoxyglucuronate dehydrogenase
MLINEGIARMTRQHGFGILGAGQVAAEYIKALRDNSSAQLVGIYSRTRGKATRLCESHGVDAREYQSLDELLNDEKIEVVVSCTPPDVRPGQVVQVIKANRHVVIEKPVALDWKGMTTILDETRTANVRTIISFTLRWNPAIAALKQIIADGTVGTLVHSEADYWYGIKADKPSYKWAATKFGGGSAFLLGGCHAVDIMRYLVGEIAEVSAYSYTARDHSDFEYDPAVVAVLRFANGATGKVSAILDDLVPYMFNVSIVGTGGAIQNGRFQPWPPKTRADIAKSLPGWPGSGEAAYLSFAREIDHFLRCIEQGDESHASIYDAYRSMAVCVWTGR